MIRISINDAPKELRRLARKIPFEGLKVMRRAARRSESLMVHRTDTAIPYPAVDRGIYREAWTVENIPTGAILFNPAPHAPIIEFGSRPHRAPFNAILEWVLRKFKRQMAARIKSETGGKRVRGVQFGFARGRKALRDKRLVALAWAVWHKIRKEGTKPRHVLTGGFPQMRSFVEQELLALKRDVEAGKL